MKALQILLAKRDRLEQIMFQLYLEVIRGDLPHLLDATDEDGPLLSLQQTYRMIKALEDGSMTEAEVLVQRLEME